MTTFRSKLLVISLALPLALPLAAQQAPQGMGQYGMPTQNGLAHPDIEGPPPGYDQMQRSAWQDGAEAARDAGADHHQQLPQRADKYRHPPIQRNIWRRYRAAFRQGFYAWERHHGGAPPPPPPTGF